MLRILLWAGWGMLLGAAVLVAVFMTAFGDAPRARRAVQRAITPVLVWIVAVVVVSLAMFDRGRWWSIALAYLLALSPPVVLMALISLLMGWDRHRSSGEERDPRMNANAHE